MRRRTLLVELDGFRSVVGGSRGVRDLVIEVAGRAPVWISRRKGYSVSERTARDVIAVAESQNWDIVITGPRASHATDEVVA